MSRRLFDANVVCNDGYYSPVSENAQELKIFERISTFFRLSRTTTAYSLQDVFFGSASTSL